MMFSLNVLLTFILWRRAQLWLKMFAFELFSSETPWLYFEKAIRLSREIFMFLTAIWSSLHVCFWRSMYRFISPLITLVQQDSNVTLLRASLLTVCVLSMPLFVLVSCYIYRSLIGLFNWFIKSAKSGRQAKIISNVAGGNFTRRSRIPHGLCPRWNARPLSHPASYAC